MYLDRALALACAKGRTGLALVLLRGDQSTVSGPPVDRTYDAEAVPVSSGASVPVADALSE
jgi:hypothetical protein